jgi:hypothetical protein
MKFTVKEMEIIKRRHKTKHPCNQDWKLHDDIVQMRHSQIIGCKAPYQNQENKLGSCSTRYEMKRAKFALRYDEYGNAPPCNLMGKITYSYSETDRFYTNLDDVGNFWIEIYHQNQNFKDIVQIRY